MNLISVVVPCYNEEAALGPFYRVLTDIAGKMDTCKCIIADNGVKMTPKEFLTYIREFNNQANEEAKTETTEG